MTSPDATALLGAAIRLRQQCAEAVEAVEKGESYAILINRIASVLVVMAATSRTLEEHARTMQAIEARARTVEMIENAQKPSRCWAWVLLGVGLGGGAAVAIARYWP